MDKNIMKALSGYNFKFDKKSGYGFIDGYEVNVLNSSFDNGPIFAFSTFLSDENKKEIARKIKERKYRMVICFEFPFGIGVKIGAISGKSFLKKFNDILSFVLELLTSLDAPKSDVCPRSGEKIDEFNSRIVKIDEIGMSFRLSETAISQINFEIEESSMEYKKSPNNYFKGFLGIFVGAIAGAAISVILGLLGYVSALAPLVSIVLGVNLYRKFGGKINYKMVVMSFVTTLVAILLSDVITYMYISFDAAKEAGVSLSLFESFKYCLLNVDTFQRAFYIDLGVNTFLILFVEIIYIFQIKKALKKPTKL